MSFFDNNKQSAYGSSSATAYSSFGTQNPNYNSQNQGYSGQSNYSGYSSNNTGAASNYKPSKTSEFDNYKPNFSSSDSNQSSSEWDKNSAVTDRVNAPKTGDNVLDPENIKYYHMFNLKKSPYKLKHYLYFSEDLNMNFDVSNYNRMDVKMGRPPHLRHYIRYYDMKYDYELNPRGKHYGDMYTLTDKNQSPNIVYSKEYRGKYANQLDYINFKVYMTQEKYK